MNKQEFFKSMEKQEPDYGKIFNKLFQGVVDTNKLFGLDLQSMDASTKEGLIGTYFQLRQEEGKEIFDAIENFDKVEYLDGLIDLLVVAGYEYYLSTGKVFTFSDNTYYDVETLLMLIEQNLNQQYLHGCEVCLKAAMVILTQLNINLEKAVDEVLASNRSKAPTLAEFIHVMGKNPLLSGFVDEDQMIDLQCDLIEAEGRYTGVIYKIIGDDVGFDRITFWSTYDKGEPKVKFIKPCTYFDANFASCWKE